MEYLSIIIAKEFKRHKSLLLHDEIDEDEKNQFRPILERKASAAELGQSLQFLTELLSRATGSKCIVLIDEYDTPIQAANESGYYKEMVDFIAHCLHRFLRIMNILNVVF